MNLTEAIKHCEDVADYDCFTDDQRKCSDEHRQLADWLRELKERREKAQLSGEDATFDCISRQKVIDALLRYPFEKVVNCISIIEEFPSAETECTCCEYRVGDLCCYSDVKTDMEAMEEGEGE